MAVTDREPDLTQRIVNGFFGAFLGAVIACLAAWYAETLVVPFAIAGAVICFAAAFAYGTRAIEWIVAVARWS